MGKLIPVIRARWGPWLGFGMFTVAAVVALLESSLAQDPSNPYWVIIERNPFDLQEPPPPPPPPPPPTTEPPVAVEVDVKLTGFSMFGDVAQVYLMIPADKENPTPRFLTLAENDVHDSIEVVSIDPANETVRIRNAGAIADLTFEEHGLKAAAAPAKPSPSSRGGQAATTSRSSTRGRTTTSSTAGRVSSGRPTPGISGSSGAASGRSGGVSSGSTGSYGLPTRQLPRRNMRTYTAGPEPSPEYQTGGDEIAVRQILQVEAQRAANPNLQFPPMPGIPGSGGGAEDAP